jgi:hypothetical protein
MTPGGIMTADEAEQAYRNGTTVAFTDGLDADPSTAVERRGRVTGCGVIYAFVRTADSSRETCVPVGDLRIAS